MWAGAGLAAVFIYDIFDRLQMLESNAKVLPRAVMIAVIFIGVLNAAKCSITSITNIVHYMVDGVGGAVSASCSK